MATESAALQRRAEVEAELAQSTMYDLLGGEPTVRSLVDRFYDLMDQDDTFGLIRDMHEADLAPMRLSLFEYLSGWLGGPPLFIQRKGSPCLVGAHAPFVIDEDASAAWMDCMSRALVDVGTAEKYRELIEPAFGRIADMMRNDA